MEFWKKTNFPFENDLEHLVPHDNKNLDTCIRNVLKKKTIQ